MYTENESQIRYVENTSIDFKLEKLLINHTHNSYISNIFRALGFPLFFVGAKVLRPEYSYVSKYLSKFLIRNTEIYRDRKVLEIGCGSGIQTLIMAMNGAKSIISTDISPFAVNSCLNNIQMFFLSKKVEIRQGDMFDCLDVNEKFDIVLFNHPFFDGSPSPTNPIEVALLDNRELAGIFLNEIWNYLCPQSIVIMPFSKICGKRNDPLNYARQLDIKYYRLFSGSDEDGIHEIYAFSKTSIVPQNLINIISKDAKFS